MDAAVFFALVWVTGSVLVAQFLVYTAFLLMCGAKLMLSNGGDLGDGMELVCKVWLVVGWPADVWYNWTRGAWRFRSHWHGIPIPEWRGVTYSAHIQWRVDQGCDDPETREWVRRLNAAAPDHIKRWPLEWVLP